MLRCLLFSELLCYLEIGAWGEEVTYGISELIS